METPVTNIEAANEDALRLQHHELLALDFCSCRKFVLYP